MTDDTMLSSVFEKLLPILLLKIGSAPPSSPVQASLLQIVGHAMTRAKANPEVTLPVDNIISLLYEPPNLKKLSSFTVNFSLAFLELGLPRHTPSTTPDSSNILPCLVCLLEAAPPYSAQSSQVSHVLLEWLRRSPSTDSSSKALSEAVAKASQTKMDCSNLFNFLLDVLVYRPPMTLTSAPGATPPTSVPRNPFPTPSPPNTALPPFGMNRAGQDRLLRCDNFIENSKRVPFS